MSESALLDKAREVFKILDLRPSQVIQKINEAMGVNYFPDASSVITTGIEDAGRREDEE